MKRRPPQYPGDGVGGAWGRRGLVGAVTPKRGERLAVGTVVRHCYDWARGRVVAVDRAGAAYRVRFEDGQEDLVTAADLRVVRQRRSPDGAKPGGAAEGRPVSDRAWKAFERRTARDHGCERTPVSGRQRAAIPHLAPDSSAATPLPADSGAAQQVPAVRGGMARLYCRSCARVVRHRRLGGCWQCVGCLRASMANGWQTLGTTGRSPESR
jgi:hypothetical protein